MGNHGQKGFWNSVVNRKALLTFAATALVILSPFWISHVIWRLGPISELSLLVVDYTVPTDSYSHHRGLFWLLNHLRIMASGSREPWSIDKDYAGYKPPGKGASRYLSQTNLKKYHWVYLSDTYGVYDIDIEGKKNEDLPASFRPKLVFGSLTLQDANALSSFVEGGGNVIFESNSFSGPTGERAREIAEHLMGVRWTGWAGRLIDDLRDKTITPRWLPDLYYKTYPNHPLPEGPALVLVHKNGTLVVLHGEPIERTAPSLVVTEQGKAAQLDSSGSPPYFGWFEIMSAHHGVEILAEVRLPTIARWEKRRKAAGIPLVFPLITRFKKDRTNRIYIAADIANLDDTPRHYQLAGLPLLQAAVNRRQDAISNLPAYWRFYLPVVGQILRRASSLRD